MSEHLEPGTDRSLRHIVAARQRSGRVPSIAAAVVRDGEQIWSTAFGADAALIDAYRIGSITKTFTAVLTLQLMADGKLSPATRVREVLGDVGYAEVTVGELLSHTGGLQAEPAGAWWERAGRSGDFPELAAANDGTDRAFDPGMHWHYSNLGFAWLGEIVARLRGTSWWSATRRRLLEPLGMSATTFEPGANAVTGWSIESFTGAARAEPNSDTGAMAPAGQLWSTCADLARWARFIGGGNVEILPDEWLERALTPRGGVAEHGLSFGYGWGFQMFPGGSGTLVGHLGSMPGFQAVLLVDRRRRTGAVCLGNATAGLDPLSLARDLLADLEQREPAIEPPWVPTVSIPDPIPEMVGVWHWGASAYRMTWDGTYLCLGGDAPLSRWRFVETADGRELRGVGGYHAGEPLRVIRNPDGTVNHLNASTFILTRTPYDTAAPIPGEPG